MDKKDLKEMRQYQKEQNKKASKYEKLQSKCDHHYINGKGKIKSFLVPARDGSGMFCTNCHRLVDFDHIPANELKGSVRTCQRMLEQIRTIDSDLTPELVQMIGTCSVTLAKLENYYNKTISKYLMDVDSYGKGEVKKKNKNYEPDMIGNFVTGPIFPDDDYKDKKHKNHKKNDKHGKHGKDKKHKKSWY